MTDELKATLKAREEVYRKAFRNLLNPDPPTLPPVVAYVIHQKGEAPARSAYDMLIDLSLRLNRLEAGGDIKATVAAKIRRGLKSADKKRLAGELPEAGEILEEVEILVSAAEAEGLKHQGATDGVSAADIEWAMDRLAREIVAFGPRGRKLLPLYERLERELAAIRAVDDVMARVLQRLAE